MARNPAAQNAFGPMVEAAIEQYEPPESRLVDDDLAASILPAGQRAFIHLTGGAVRATFAALQAAPSGSRLVFTYVRNDFIDVRNMYGAAMLYKRFRQLR